MKSIASASMNISTITSFGDNFDPLSMNNSFKAETFEPEPTFGKTINKIKANGLKNITSIYINVSAIIYNKLSLYS